jgi:hypothetical protein
MQYLTIPLIIAATWLTLRKAFLIKVVISFYGGNCAHCIPWPFVALCVGVGVVLCILAWSLRLR